MRKRMAKMTAVLLALVLFSVVGCVDDEVAPPEWWEDYANLTFVLTDDRADTEDFVWERPRDETYQTPEFVYTVAPKSQEVSGEEETEEAEETEYIPDFKVYYKGEEKKEVYVHVWHRYVFMDGYRDPVIRVTNYGRYQVDLSLFLEGASYWDDDEIVGVIIYITVQRGGEQ